MISTCVFAVLIILILCFGSPGSLFGYTAFEGCTHAVPIPTISSPTTIVIDPQSSTARHDLNPVVDGIRNESTQSTPTWSTSTHDPPAAHEAPEDDGGPLAEEIAVYVCIGLAVLLVGVCCYFCSKHCWCPRTRRPTAVVYRHMTIPANVSIFTRHQDNSAGFGLLRPDVSPGVRRVSPIRTEDILLASLPTLEELESLYQSQYGHLHRSASSHDLDRDHDHSPPPPYDLDEEKKQLSI